MVKQIKIGIIGIQGAISEHANIMQKTLKKNKKPGKVIIIRDKNQINDIDGLLIPGGESTTISNFLIKNGMYDEILNRINENNIAIMGTCAGCVLLAKKIIKTRNNNCLLKAIDMKVIRNAFGGQRQSFEKKIDIKGFKKPYNAFFIRAPIIKEVWSDCKILAKVDNKIVMVRQNNFLALSFHPELTEDTRIHEYFLDMIN